MTLRGDASGGVGGALSRHGGQNPPRRPPSSWRAARASAWPRRRQAARRNRRSSDSCLVDRGVRRAVDDIGPDRGGVPVGAYRGIPPARHRVFVRHAACRGPLGKPPRQESAFSGLEFVPEEYEYAIPSRRRPSACFPDLISHTINTLKGMVDADGAIVATPAVDTLKVVEGGCIVGHARPPRVLERPDAAGVPQRRVSPRPRVGPARWLRRVPTIPR